MDAWHCPRCGERLAPRRLKPGGPEHLACATCDFVHYLDPKVAAGCIVEVTGGIVLLRRAIEPAYGRWVFPGGYVDRGERVEDAAIRETLEESCLQVRLTGLLGVYSYTGRPVVVVVYTGERVGGELAAADESLAAHAFAPGDVPWSDLAFRSTFDALRDYLRRAHGAAPPAGILYPGLEGPDEPHS